MIPKIGVFFPTKDNSETALITAKKHLEFTIPYVYKFVVVDDGSKIPFVCDGIKIIRQEQWLGIPAARNKALSYLQDCDYIFNMDDDTFPLVQGWYNHWLKAFKNYPYQHLFFGMPDNRFRIIQDYGTCAQFNCGSTFMVYDQKCIEKIGGYSDYSKYGWEDTEYADRATRNGLCPLGNMVSPKHSQDYMWQLDYSGAHKDYPNRIHDASLEGKTKYNWITESANAVYTRDTSKKYFKIE